MAKPCVCLKLWRDRLSRYSSTAWGWSLCTQGVKTVILMCPHQAIILLVIRVLVLVLSVCFTRSLSSVMDLLGKTARNTEQLYEFMTTRGLSGGQLVTYKCCFFTTVAVMLCRWIVISWMVTNDGDVTSTLARRWRSCRAEILLYNPVIL